MWNNLQHPKRHDVEAHEMWRNWGIEKVPFLKLDPDWEICVIPPFAGAMARFVLKKGDHTISVYMDTLQALGCWEVPHWEIYPNATGDSERFALSEPDRLLEAIHLSFEVMESADPPSQN